MVGDDWYSFGLANMEREVERMIRSFFSEYRERMAFRRGQPSPQVDVYESKDQIRIVIELGGMIREDIEVHVTSDMVIIEGEKKEDEAAGEKRKYICLEREFGPFRRLIEIPGAVDTGQIQAEMKQGILSLFLPKIVDRRKRRRKILIESKD